MLVNQFVQVTRGNAIVVGYAAYVAFGCHPIYNGQNPGHFIELTRLRFDASQHSQEELFDKCYSLSCIISLPKLGMQSLYRDPYYLTQIRNTVIECSDFVLKKI